jgi:hypothetical protein
MLMAGDSQCLGQSLAQAGRGALRSTDAIESMIGICREHAKNRKPWRDGQMATAGAPPACSKPANSSAAPTALCSCPPYAPHSSGMSPSRLSVAPS